MPFNIHRFPSRATRDTERYHFFFWNMLLHVARVLVSVTLASLIIFLSRWSVLSVCEGLHAAQDE